MADELDSLYRVRPDAFTGERTKLAAEAKRRGDGPAAKRITAARKPTMSAWIVNRLALTHTDTAGRLGELGDRLRDAHAAMDGDRIRELSSEQHKLIEQLARAAFEAAEVTAPSSSVRDDVTGTLQAAIADPEVRARLGRLTKPEQWSGFGGFAEAASAAKPARKPQPRADEPKRRREKLLEVVKAAERDLADADEALAQRRADRDAAEGRRDDALRAVRAAERELNAAQEKYDRAEQTRRTAAEVVEEAKRQLKRA